MADMWRRATTPGTPIATGVIRAAAVLAVVLGLGFGLPCVYAIAYFANHGLVWMFAGFPTYGDGPFVDIGIETSVPLLAAFLLVCVAEVVAGWLLWRRRRSGGTLALALIPLEFIFWIGFALPLGPPIGVARTVLVLVGWRSLSTALSDWSRR